MDLLEQVVSAIEISEKASEGNDIERLIYTIIQKIMISSLNGYMSIDILYRKAEWLTDENIKLIIDIFKNNRMYLEFYEHSSIVDTFGIRASWELGIKVYRLSTMLDNGINTDSLLQAMGKVVSGC